MTTTVTHGENNEPYFGKRPLITVAGVSSFAGMVYEMISGKIPSQSELELFELILNLSIDHGPDSPSAKATIVATKTRKGIGESVAAGIAVINEKHGGAQEPMMRLLYEMRDGKSAAEIVSAHISLKKHIPGFGHRLYTKDPRAESILKKVCDLQLSKTFIIFARELEEELSRAITKELPINIDGAIAVALCTLNWKPQWSTSVFIIARSAGLSAHAINHSVTETAWYG